MKVYKTIKELIDSNNTFINSIPNQLGINLCSVRGIEYDYVDLEGKELRALNILFKEDENQFKNEKSLTITQYLNEYGDLVHYKNTGRFTAFELIGIAEDLKQTSLQYVNTCR